MTLSKIQFSEIRYNPELKGFQARATIFEPGMVYVYPVHVQAPLTADFTDLSQKLSEKARKKHATRSKTLHMRRPLTEGSAIFPGVQAA